MAAEVLDYINASERMVGAGHVSLADTLNRAQRDMLSKSGYDPDAAFSGLRGPVCNVRAYGAVGDGVTDDTAALQAAITAAEVFGGVVEFPKTSDYYLVTAELDVVDMCTLQGPGEVRTSSTTAPVLNITGSNVTIDGLRIVGPSTHTSAVSTGNGIVVTGASAASPATSIIVRNCYISGFNLYGILLEWVTGFEVAENTVTECANTGIGALSCLEGRVTHNTVDTIGDATNTYGIFFSRRETDSIVTEPLSADIICAGNRVFNVASWNGLDTHGGVRIKFADNLVVGCFQGINVGGTDNSSQVTTWAPEDVSVVDNVLDSKLTDGTAGVGIQFTGASDTVLASGSIVGNIVRNHGPDTASSGNGAVRVRRTQGVVIADNVVWNPAPRGFALVNKNVDFQLVNNTVIDVWSELSTVPSLCHLDDADNTGRISGNRLSRASKTATYVNIEGLRVSLSSGNVLGVYDNDFTAATTPITNSQSAQFVGRESVKRTSVGDADVTLTVGASSERQCYDTPLTANRTVTLSTTDAYDGAVFEIIRTALGEFTLAIGSLITLPPGVRGSVRVIYRAGAWQLASVSNMVVPTSWAAAKTGDYTVVNADDGLFLGGTSHTLTLQATSTRKRPLTLRSIASGTWTISRAGSDTVEGATSITLNAGEAITLMPNSTDWLIVS